MLAVERWARWLIVAAVVLALAGCRGLFVTDTQSLLTPRLMCSEVMGFVAGIGTTFAAVPDLVAMLRRKSTRGMNPRMAAIMGTFQIFWIWYGLLIGSRPVVLWNIIGVITNFCSVGAYLYFASKDRLTF